MGDLRFTVVEDYGFPSPFADDGQFHTDRVFDVKQRTNIILVLVHAICDRRANIITSRHQASICTGGWNWKEHSYTTRIILEPGSWLFPDDILASQIPDQDTQLPAGDAAFPLSSCWIETSRRVFCFSSHHVRIIVYSAQSSFFSSSHIISPWPHFVFYQSLVE